MCIRDRCGLLLRGLIRLGSRLLRLRLIWLLVLNRLRGDGRHLIGIAHGRRIGDRRERNGLIAASLRLGLRLKIQVRFAAVCRRALAIVGRKKDTDNDQQEACDDTPAVHRGQRVQEAKMIRGCLLYTSDAADDLLTV